MIHRYRKLTFLALSALTATAQADIFTGATVKQYYLYPTINAIYYNAGSTTVNPSGATFSVLNQFGDGTVTFANNQIDVFVSAVGTTLPGTFNGMEWTFSNMANITNAYLDQASAADFAGSIITFDQHDVFINWASHAHPTPDHVLIDVFTSPVPEPASIALLASGLLGVFSASRRKSS